MDSDFLQLLCALLALVLPLGFAWLVVWWQHRATREASTRQTESS